jgi:hypothetical protein
MDRVQKIDATADMLGCSLPAPLKQGRPGKISMQTEESQTTDLRDCETAVSK